MGLFDDILKKPANIPMPPADPLAGSTPAGQGGASGTGSDDGATPVIVKSDAQVFGISETKTTPDTPTESTVHAEEDASSVLVTPSVPTPAPAAVSPVVETISVPATVTTAEVTPDPVIPGPSEATVAPTPSIMIEAVPTLAKEEALEIPQGPSLFDHIMSDTPVAVASVPEVAPITQEVTPVALETPMTSTPSMFGGMIEDALIATPTVEVSAPERAPVEAHGEFSTPREFIEKSLASIALMLGNIDKRHTAKKEEERGYREEKMRFAELEKNAYVEAEIMDRERDHALRMQSMFQSELDTDTANREKKVHHTETRHEERHMKKKHENEEEVLMAS